MDRLRLYLSATGFIADPSLPPGQTMPWYADHFGEYLPRCYHHLDDYCDQLSVCRVSSYFFSSENSASDPEWHSAKDGHNTFRAIVTELLGRIGTSDTFELVDEVLWESRCYELILAQALIDGERFYIGD